MPLALIPALIGVVTSIVGAATKGDGKKDLRTQEQKEVGASVAQDFNALDAYGGTLDPLNIDTAVNKYSSGAVGGGVGMPQNPMTGGMGRPPTLDFMQNIPTSPGGARPQPAPSLTNFGKM